VALRTNCIKNATIKVIKIRTGFQYVGYFYSENLNWATQNLRLGRGLDIAFLSLAVLEVQFGKSFKRKSGLDEDEYGFI